MTKRIGRVMFASVGMLLAFAASSDATDVTLTGIVSDSTCAKDHRGRDAEECVRACLQESGQYALVVGSQVYTLVAEDDAKAMLYELAGHSAIVTGERERGDVVIVKTVSDPLPETVIISFVVKGTATSLVESDASSSAS